MLIRFCILIWLITIIAIVAVGFIMAKITENIIYPTMQKYRLQTISLQTIDEYSNSGVKMIPIANKSGEIAYDKEFLLLVNTTQRILENTIKTNDEIAFMAVYSDNGTIIAHSKPERIGKNMFDVDVEFNNYTQEIFKAIGNRKTYKGFNYDPTQNEHIRFLVKPLQIGNYAQDLSLLVGVWEY